MIQKLRNDKQGFTLIELMIVIAIIGILAAIAVPQFLAYRIRSYNSAAKAVAHNVKADEGNLNSELGEYGHTNAAAAQLDDAFAAVGTANTHATTALRMAATSTTAGARLVGQHSISNRVLAIGIALGDNMICRAEDTNTNPDSFVVTTRHFKGDTAYGMDSDVENAIYSVSNPNWPGQESANNGLMASPPAASDNNDDFSGTDGGGSPTAAWTLNS